MNPLSCGIFWVICTYAADGYPALDAPVVLAEICQAFGLDNALLQKIEVKNDGSTQYHCHFDDPLIT